MDPSQTIEPTTTPRAEHTPYTLWQSVCYFLRLGALGFGGPVALVGSMQRDLVEQRAWITETDYKESLALAQLCPGPLAAQLAMYLGYIRSRILGAMLVGLAFIWPSFLVTAAVTIVTQTEQVLLFIAAGVLVWLVKSPPRAFWRFWGKGNTGIPSFFPVPLAAVFAVAGTTGGTLWAVFTFFTAAGAFVFGSGLAINPFLYGGVMQGHHWLTDRQFVDAVAVAMITPGPVVITSGFIGFLVAGLAGAAAAALWPSPPQPSASTASARLSRLL